MRGLFVILTASLLGAQQATPTRQATPTLTPPTLQATPTLGAPTPQATPTSDQDAPIGNVTVRIVMAPATVTDRLGNIVDGLQPSDFRLFDNGKLQRVTEDMTSHPLSLVVAVQANEQVEKILPQVQKLGALLQAQVLGDEGEAAILAFDSRVQTMTGFTSDPDKIAMALKKIKAGSWTSRLNDATLESINLLKTRPPTRRRVLLLISEAGDKGSQIRPREVLAAAEFANIVIYSIDISHVLSSLTATPPPPSPDTRPPGAVHLPAGNVATPTTDSQMALGDWTPLIKDVFNEAKSVFVKNPLEVFTNYSGGRQYSFLNQKTLDRAVSDLGNELHSQYLLTYVPNNQQEAGYHNIVVQVAKPDLRIRARDGYYLAGTPEGAKK
ncbi:MAG TPA: VWA domain-containing protein [Bryobacteraceae bacterium]|nr:VWA domain-containing protein [Bryobacteraceae bacterium]